MVTLRRREPNVSGRDGPPSEGWAVLPDGLTPLEVEVLCLLTSGLTNRQIAAELVLSAHTVERHVNNAYSKIQAHNRATAAAYSVRNGLWVS
jgi:DNA-binding NarL/FixJ family response regulator